jgi:hypothetical protein
VVAKNKSLEVLVEAIWFLPWPENLAPLSIMFYGTAATLPPCPPPRELLLPRYIPEMHSRGVGQLEGGGCVNGGQEVKSQQGMECKCIGAKEFGGIWRIQSAQIPTKGTAGRLGVIERDKEREKAQDSQHVRGLGE